MTIQWNPDAALAKLRRNLIDGANTAAEEIATTAVQKAPLGKGEHQRRAGGAHTSAIELRPESDFKGDRVATARRRDLAKLTDRQLVNEVTSGEAKFFRFTHGGETVEELAVRRGKLRGVGKPYVPGTLKKGIHAVPAQVQGSQVIASVVSSAPYSNLVERGFHHKGGTQVAARPFMRPAADEVEPKWKSGSLIKKG